MSQTADCLCCFDSLTCLGISFPGSSFLNRHRLTASCIAPGQKLRSNNAEYRVLSTFNSQLFGSLVKCTRVKDLEDVFLKPYGDNEVGFQCPPDSFDTCNIGDPTWHHLRCRVRTDKCWNLSFLRSGKQTSRP